MSVRLFAVSYRHGGPVAQIVAVPSNLPAGFVDPVNTWRDSGLYDVTEIATVSATAPVLEPKDSRS